MEVGLLLDVLWTERGDVTLTSCSDTEALDRIRLMLNRQDKPLGSAGPDVIAFRDDLFRRGSVTSNLKAMAACDAGRFWIEVAGSTRRLRYELSLRQGLVFCCWAALAFAIVGALGSGWKGVLQGLLLGLGWLYGMNRLLVSWRVPRLVKLAVLRA